MFKLKEKIPNVRFHIEIDEQENLLYLQNQNIIVNKTLIYQGKSIIDFGLKNGSIYIVENDKVVFTNVKKQFVNIFDKPASVSFINDNEVLLSYNSVDYSKKYKCRYNIKNKKVLWTIEKVIAKGLINNEILYSGWKWSVISKISLTTPQTPQWQFDLSQLGTYYNTWDKKDENYRVEKFIGIYNDVLYVALNLYSETIIAIDIKTGKLLNQWKNIPFTLGANLDTEQQQIFGLIKKEFWQINLETAEFTITNIHPVLQNIEFENVRDQVNIPITDKHYIIKLQTAVDTANSNRIYDGLALFNKNTQQIDWHYLFGNETWLASNEPKITTNKIFQLSNEGNLFIFEKTSNENV